MPYFLTALLIMLMTLCMKTPGTDATPNPSMGNTGKMHGHVTSLHRYSYMPYFVAPAATLSRRVWEAGRTAAPVLTVASLFLTVFEKRKHGCWRDAYHRGPGRLRFRRCPAHQTRKGLMCYAPCRQGYRSGPVGPICWQRACPAHAPRRCGLLCLGENVSCTERTLKAAAVGFGMITSALTGLIPLTLVGGATMTIDLAQFPTCRKVFDAEDMLMMNRRKFPGLSTTFDRSEKAITLDNSLSDDSRSFRRVDVFPGVGQAQHTFSS